ncbi:Hypothetical predicted protein [Octopus vulgaris]|uniref:Uncharacterized protein n=1 Tax=Octopus vulgaris TaxID=6645 RepID=A0AA36B2Y9_OCTVU|nr:Hypothetical predicted protein [Octopus vulgaris]
MNSCVSLWCCSTRKRAFSEIHRGFANSVVDVSFNIAIVINNDFQIDGINVETPLQSGIYRLTIKEVVKLKKKTKKTLYLENLSLHFVGKLLNDQEYQVLVLKNGQGEVKLEALQLADGKADPVVKGIRAVLNGYNLWNCIKMIVADTMSVNTGKRNGIVIQLQRLFAQKGLKEPQFIGCQHHVLDRDLRVVMDSGLGGKKSSPNIKCTFIPELLSNYEKLQANFNNGEEKILESAGW